MSESDMETPATALRILTLNTWKCDGAYHDRIAWMCDEMAMLGPDVICVQEAFRTADGSVDTARVLADALGYHLSWTRARRKLRNLEGETVDSWSGLAMLSRHRIIETAVQELPADPADGQRIVQACRLELEGQPGRDVVIANTHLVYLPHTEALRREEMGCCLRFLQEFAGDLPALICGDMNTIAAAEGLATFIDGDGPIVLRDGYARGSGATPCSTLVRHRVEDGGGGDLRIDHIFAAEWPGQPPVTFSNAAIAMDRPKPGTNIYPSDHLGVLVTAVVG